MSDMIKHSGLDQRYMDRVIATAVLAGAVIVTVIAPRREVSFGVTLHFLEAHDIHDERIWFGSRFEAAQAFLAQHDIVVT